MENNKPFEINFDKPEDFLTPQEKTAQVLRLVEGLEDLKRKYEVDPKANEMQLDQINFRLDQQKATLAKLGYEEPKLERPSMDVADMDEAVGAQHEAKVNNNMDQWLGETLH
jgi:hypothetical protein